jgi:hypothetical protein
MTFSREDRAAWENSEIMKELEKYAEDVLVPEEPEESWEEEDWEDPEEEELIDAVDEFNEPSLEEELSIAHHKMLLVKLNRLAEHYADESNIKVAYRIERAVQNIKALLREG